MEITAKPTSSTVIHFPEQVNGFADILNFYGLNYQPADYYWQVGEISKVQGWILHISVITSQIMDLLQKLIPVLIEEKTPFKIPMDQRTFLDLLNGSLGDAQIGKIVCIYPETDKQAVSLAKRLVPLTISFKGPAIPTDILLGNIVYTRYGSFNPVLRKDSNGKDEKYIYDHNNQLVKDPYFIPFKLPKGISWPFAELASPIVPAPPKVLKGIYRILGYIKEDPKGHVYKGLYLKSLFRVITCVIKQGKKNMSSEYTGRDMHDRLAWQQELYHQLADSIPLATIYDLFKEDGDSYLIMEFIEGQSLFDKIHTINPKNKSWFELDSKDALKLLDYTIDIISIIEKMHQKGFVHRDIVPVNFIIDKNDRIYLIDLELAYSLNERKPSPPYQYGTTGFMSPEQQAVLEPTTQEDIYALGALMAQVFTGISPIKFDTSNQSKLRENIRFFIGSNDISTLIASCLDQNPQHRPSIHKIKMALHQFREEQVHTKNINTPGTPLLSTLNSNQLKETIATALVGLSKAPVVVLKDLWYSKLVNASNKSTVEHLEYSRFVGLDKGIAGILYLLARAKIIGFNIESNINGYTKGWDFIKEQFASLENDIPPGFMSGAAGAALALAEGMKAGLIENTEINTQQLQSWLQIPSAEMDLANGISGQCCALMQCAPFIGDEYLKNTLHTLIQQLLELQQKNGLWQLPLKPGEIEKEKIKSFRFGITGIIWVLLEYGITYQNQATLSLADKALSRILKNDGLSNNNSIINKRVKPEDRPFGVIITLIKAYEVLQENKYKAIAEKILMQYPSNIVTNNFTQHNGLAGIGELYLEAARTFRNEEWKNRANWIANAFIHTLIRNPDRSGYWKIEERNEPTADFMEGISGIIHFLLHYMGSEKIGYRFLK